MPINPIRPLSKATKPVNPGIQSFGFSNTPVGRFTKLINEAMSGNKTDDAISIFKGIINHRVPGFAEKVLESAPIFAALVAKMAVDQIMKDFEVERERAEELQDLAEKYAKAIKKVSPAQPL